MRTSVLQCRTGIRKTAEPGGVAHVTGGQEFMMDSRKGEGI